MKILIDADGCPVVDATIHIAKRFEIKGADSVDFALVNMLNADDIVVTQDYGLAAMSLEVAICL